jgi:hypothetical protein
MPAYVCPVMLATCASEEIAMAVLLERPAGLIDSIGIAVLLLTRTSEVTSNKE